MKNNELNKLNRRPYQVDALRAFRAGQVRLFCLLWERQSGKSTTLADNPPKPKVQSRKPGQNGE